MTSSGRTNRPMAGAEWAMLLALSLVWGGSFFFNEIALEALPPLTVVFGRVVLAALILLCLGRALGVAPPTAPGLWAAFLLMGLLNNAIPFGLIVWSQTEIASGVAAILNATTPLFTVLVAHVATADEKITPARLLGVGLGFAGVAAMIGTEATGRMGSETLAEIAVLGAAASYALAGVFGRRFARQGVAPLQAATGQVIASSVLLAPAALLIDRPWESPPPGPEAIGALVGVAALSTALAYWLYFRILATAGATNLLLVTFLAPVSAILLGVLILGESLAPRHLLGMACIGLALAVIDGRLPKQARAAFSRAAGSR